MTAAVDSPARGRLERPATGSRVYADHAQLYRAAGWRYPLVLPRARKAWPLRGFTGYSRVAPSGADIAEMAALRPGGNLALGMDQGVEVGGALYDLVMVDVDHYRKDGEDKRGGDTVELIERAAGVTLPPTFKITSRGPGVSGKYAYLVPAGTTLTTALPGIELVQWFHRYAVAPPSSNPDSGGTRFEWRVDARPVLGADGTAVGERIPSPTDMTIMPPQIVAVLAVERNHVAPVPVEVDAWRAWFTALPAGPPCREVQRKFSKAVERAYGRTGLSRYDGTRDSVLSLMRAGEQGHSGADAALRALRGHYVRGVAGSRAEKIARAEFGRMLRPEAVGKLLADPTPDDSKHCLCPEGLAAVLLLVPDDGARDALVRDICPEGVAVVLAGIADPHLRDTYTRTLGAPA